MLLRGITFDNKAYTFTLKECPVLLNESTIALVNKSNSELLQQATISRGDSKTGIFEGDIVFDKDLKILGYIVYSKGFKTLTKDNKLLEIEDCKGITIKENTTSSVYHLLQGYRDPIELSYHELTFSINSFVTVRGNILHVNKKLLYEIPIDEVNISTGLTNKGNPIYYGDHTKSGLIVLNNYKPMVRLYGKEEIYRELESDEYDEY